MVLEHLDIRIRPGEQAQFEPALERGLREVIARAPGMLGWQIHKGVESPERYVVLIRWESKDAHLVGYRQSPLSPEFRAIVLPFFAQPPVMEHVTLLTQSREAAW